MNYANIFLTTNYLVKGNNNALVKKQRQGLDSIAYLDTQIKEKTHLGEEGLFVTEEEYPRFARQEIIVNAVIRYKDSFDRMEILEGIAKYILKNQVRI